MECLSYLRWSVYLRFDGVFILGEVECLYYKVRWSVYLVRWSVYLR